MVFPLTWVFYLFQVPPRSVEGGSRCLAVASVWPIWSLLHFCLFLMLPVTTQQFRVYLFWRYFWLHSQTQSHAGSLSFPCSHSVLCVRIRFSLLLIWNFNTGFPDLPPPTVPQCLAHTWGSVRAAAAGDGFLTHQTQQEGVGIVPARLAQSWIRQVQASWRGEGSCPESASPGARVE